MKMYYMDTETVSLNGPAVLIQYAIDDGPIVLHDVWTNPMTDTLKLIEEMMDNCVVAFNISFDHFQLCKLYTMFSLYLDKYGSDDYPEDCIEKLALLEPDARDGKCLKPRSCFDIMLHARKGPYQSTMDRHDIIIKKVPTALAWQLCAELESRVKLPDIYFARKKDHSAQWQVDDIEDDGQIDPDWKNISLRFNPSSALKALAVDALKIKKDDLLLFTDISINKKFVPQDKKLGYAPFALAHAKKRDNGSIDWTGTWPDVIRHHIDHWLYHTKAREYAGDDVDYTRRLYEYFGKPSVDDDDSTLACMVAACRWKGFRVDLKKVYELRTKALNSNKKIITKTLPSGEVKEIEFSIPTAPKPVLYYITELMDDTEKLGFETNNGKSTKKVVLESLCSWQKECDCLKDGSYDKHCEKCQGKGLVEHPVALRAKEVLSARMANYEVDFYDKLLLARRLHADLNIIGALSGRMSGASGLNVQGVKKTKEVRSCFPLAWPDQLLCGGDFSGFEVTLAEACYNDPDLRKDLLTCEACEGQMSFYKGKHYFKEILSSDSLKRRLEWRIKSEEKESKKKPAYIKKTEEEINEESFENDFICPNCGSNEGKAIHALFGVFVFPEHDYYSLKKTKGTADDKYARAKSGVFALMYGGTEFTLEERLGVPSEVAVEARAKFYKRYPGVGRSQKRIVDSFCSMRQPGGIGSRVEWHQPKDYVESLFGFRRYFILENQICKALFDLANKPPPSWKDIRIRVQRRDRMQTAYGAVQSALFAAAFGLQSSNTRAAVNHEIQSSGAQVTKFVQRKIWDIQPPGVNDFIVELLNVHDEIMAPCNPDYKDKVKEIVNQSVEHFREKVPLIKLEWVIGLKDWSEK